MTKGDVVSGATLGAALGAALGFDANKVKSFKLSFQRDGSWEVEMTEVIRTDDADKLVEVLRRYTLTERKAEGVRS